jgi:glycosyltransferase involved in cell wall biosynthesis
MPTMPILGRLGRLFGGRKQLQVDQLPLDFDARGYLELNPDLAEKQINPFEHYLLVGQWEGRTYKDEEQGEAWNPASQLPADFDPEEYRRVNPDLANFTGNLTTHFLLHGIKEFRRYREDKKPLIPALKKYERLPSDFDPDVYVELNPDVDNPEIIPQDHYVELGLHEGRQHRFPDVQACIGKPLDANKPTVLLVSHEASRTGAPVLTWNILQEYQSTHNTVVLLLGDGALLSNFQVDANETYLVPSAKHNRHTARHVIAKLKHRHNIEFAVLNSIETGALCRPLTMGGIPNILLVHEFAANTSPPEKFLDSRTWASLTLFSTQLTKDDAVRCFPNRGFDDALVIPQGRCLVPRAIQLQNRTTFVEKAAPADTLDMVTGKRKLVIGLGSVCIRKGVDLFIEVASQMRSMAGTDGFEFLWVGGGYPDYDPEYSAFLADHIQRAGLEDVVHIVPDTDNLDALYEASSLLLLTSRLDPLPNIAIDAICKGLPLACFDKASGIADVLKASNLGEDCVAAYLNTTDMATKALALCDERTLPRIKAALLAIGGSTFSMPGYCQELSRLKEKAKEIVSRHASTARLLIESERFDLAYYRGNLPPKRLYERTYVESIWEYMLQTRQATVVRKPAPGFNPLVYKERMQLDQEVDPFLHHIQNPDNAANVLPRVIGPSHEVLKIEDAAKPVALHIHAYYPDLLVDILERVGKNHYPIDLYITVDSEAKQKQVHGLLETHSAFRASVSIHANKGRDVYPFLALFESLKDHYEIVGHVHTKKSPHVQEGSDLVSRWREMLLGNLLGSERCENMADRIISHLRQYRDTQVIFPDDPHIIGWGKNRKFALQLIDQARFNSLPEHFEFPVGTMFWATSAFLTPLASSRPPEELCPVEPLPIDGTILHAWERLLGATAASTPPQYALTFVPGLTR